MIKENVKKAKMISKIVAQITEYYVENGTTNFQIKMDKNKKEYVIYTFGYIDLTQDEVVEMKKAMSAHNDIEYIEYWELIGEGNSFDEFTLIARICDSVHVNYEDGILEMVLKKTI